MSGKQGRQWQSKTVLQISSKYCSVIGRYDAIQIWVSIAKVEPEPKS